MRALPVRGDLKSPAEHALVGLQILDGQREYNAVVAVRTVLRAHHDVIRDDVDAVRTCPIRLHASLLDEFLQQFLERVSGALFIVFHVCLSRWRC